MISYPDFIHITTKGDRFVRYKERHSGMVMTVRTTVCPLQIEGDCNGQVFYFRSKDGQWTFGVGSTLHEASKVGMGWIQGFKLAGTNPGSFSDMLIDEGLELTRSCLQAFQAQEQGAIDWETAKAAREFAASVRHYKNQGHWNRSGFFQRVRCTGAEPDSSGQLYTTWERAGKPICYIGPVRVPFWLFRLVTKLYHGWRLA